MPQIKKKCISGNHTSSLSSVLVRYCPQCGELVNKNAEVFPNCEKFHVEKKSRGYKYCPDCGEKL